MAVPAFVAPLSASPPMQTAATCVTHSLLRPAPLITTSARLWPPAIGRPASLVAAGTVLLGLLLGPFLGRLDPVRTLLAGAIIAALLVLVAAPAARPTTVPTPGTASTPAMRGRTARADDLDWSYPTGSITSTTEPPCGRIRTVMLPPCPWITSLAPVTVFGIDPDARAIAEIAAAPDH